MFGNKLKLVLISLGLFGKIALSSYVQKFEESLAERLNFSQLVFRGFIPFGTNFEAKSANSFVHFEVLDVYKSEKPLKSRTVNITFEHPIFALENCKELNVRDFIVFCRTINTIIRGTSLIKWNEKEEEHIWKILGWSSWTDWSSCTVSCGKGTQKRSRICQKDQCNGHETEERMCNIFDCEGIVNPLEIGKSKYFHTSRNNWPNNPEKSPAWKFKVDSYIWIASPDMFPFVDGRWLPKYFTLFLTLRTGKRDEIKENFGTVLSLRSKRRQDTYFSVEVAGNDIKIVLAFSSDTKVLRIPMTLYDGLWHQIAIGLRNDITLDAYVDCEWSSTIILGNNSIIIPGDSDLIIGYLFAGDIEQVLIASNASVGHLQCTNQKNSFNTEDNNQEPKF